MHPETQDTVPREVAGGHHEGPPAGPRVGLARPGRSLWRRSCRRLCARPDRLPPPGRPFDVPRWAGWGPKASSRLFEAGHCPVAHTPQNLGGIVVTRGEPQARDLGGRWELPLRPSSAHRDTGLSRWRRVRGHLRQVWEGARARPYQSSRCREGRPAINPFVPRAREGTKA